MTYDLAISYDRQRARAYLDHLIGKGKKIELKEIRPKRTIDQNSLFHKWIQVFAEHIGEPSFEDCKRDVKRALLGEKERINPLTNQTEKVDYKTSQMDTKELSEFMDKFKSWAQVEFGCYLPYIGDVGYNDLITNYR